MLILKKRLAALSEEDRRFTTPLLIAILAKASGALWLHYQFSLGHFTLSDAFGHSLPTSVFSAWDSGWYMYIAEFGYAYRFPQAYAFFPGYPLVIRALWLITRNIVFSAVLPALVFGVAWTPFFQAVAEHYMSRTEAMGCTLLAAFFPIVFLSTTVAYSESLFLFACVASWYFYLKKKPLYASLLAAVATITRITGIFIVIPMFLDLLLRREWSRLPYTLIPPLAFLGWMTYCFIGTGDWLAFWSAQAAWPWAGTGPFIGVFIPFLLGVQVTLESVVIHFFIFTIIAGYLIFHLWDHDWRLAIYASSLLLTLILAGPPSLRYVSFIFPIWLSIRTKNRMAVAISCVLSYLFTLMLWHQFLVANYGVLSIIMV